MSEKQFPSAIPFDPAGGRKYFVMWFVLVFLTLTFAAVIVKGFIHLKDLDTDQLLNICWAMAAISGAFIGVEGIRDIRAAAPTRMAATTTTTMTQQTVPPPDETPVPPSEDEV